MCPKLTTIDRVENYLKQKEKENEKKKVRLKEFRKTAAGKPKESPWRNKPILNGEFMKYGKTAK